MAGIKIKFCTTIVMNIKSNPLDKPIIEIQTDIVYPKQNPLYNIIPKTTGIPNYSRSKKPDS